MYEKGSASCPKQMNTDAMPMRVATEKKKKQFLDIARVWTEAATEVESSPLPNDSMKA
jgi:hypothetical protein